MAGVPVGELLWVAVAVVAAGVVTGLLAGLFGIGGGAVIVPVLFEVFRLLGVPEEVREAMKFHFAMTIDEVLNVALEPSKVEPKVAAA